MHIAAHILVPLLVALLFFRPRWKSSFAIMLCGWLIDVDHLLATPTYDPLRCSIGFHPLHGPVAISVYTVLFCLPKTRLIGLGLLIHIILDALDCVFPRGIMAAG